MYCTQYTNVTLNKTQDFFLFFTVKRPHKHELSLSSIWFGVFDLKKSTYK